MEGGFLCGGVTDIRFIIDSDMAMDLDRITDIIIDSGNILQ